MCIFVDMSACALVAILGKPLVSYLHTAGASEIQMRQSSDREEETPPSPSPLGIDKKILAMPLKNRVCNFLAFQVEKRLIFPYW